MFDLHGCHLDPPRISSVVQNALKLSVYLFPLCQEFIQFHLTAYAPQGGLGQLRCGKKKILHLDDGIVGIHDPEVYNGIHLYRNVIPGDHVLGREDP